MVAENIVALLQRMRCFLDASLVAVHILKPEEAKLNRRCLPATLPSPCLHAAADWYAVGVCCRDRNRQSNQRATAVACGLSSGWGRHLMLLCSVSAAFAELYEGEGKGFEVHSQCLGLARVEPCKCWLLQIPFGNGLLGQCALSQQNIVVSHQLALASS